MSAQTALVTGGSGYFGALLVDHLLDRRLPGAGARPGRRRRPSRRRGARPGGHPRPRHRGATPSPGSTWCSTTSPRCRWPGTGTLFESVNVGGTAVLLAACERAGVAKVVHTSSSAVFGVPRANPVTRATEPAARGDLRTRQARRRAALPGRGHPRARRLGRSGPARSWVTVGSASSGSSSTGSPTARPCRCWGPVTTSTSSSTPPTSPTRACRAAERPGPGRLQHRRRAVRHDARGTRGAVRPRRDRLAGAQRPGRPDRCRDAGERTPGPESVRAVPLDHVRQVDVVRRGTRPRRSSAGEHAGRTRRCCATPTTGSCATGTRCATAASAHRRSARQGAAAARQAAAARRRSARSRPRWRP